MHYEIMYATYILTYRRQSLACLRDIRETQSAHFTTCNALSQKIADVNMTLSQSDITTFCASQTCPTFLTTLAKALETDCDVPGVVSYLKYG